MGEKLLTASETAALWGLRPATLARWRWAGHGPAYIKVGRAVRYDPLELRRWVEARTRTSTTDAAS
jgi:hypothetical protein